MHGKWGKIIGRRELWGANRRPVNQPPIIIDTGSTSLTLPASLPPQWPPSLQQTLSSLCIGIHHQPPFSPSNTPDWREPLVSSSLLLCLLCLPADRHPTACRDKRTADTIIYFANVLQNCRYSFSVQSIQFSALRVRSDGSERRGGIPRTRAATVLSLRAARHRRRSHSRDRDAACPNHATTR